MAQTADRHVYHVIARAFGIALGDTAAGCACALCGPSPFAAAGTTADLLGVGWSDWVLMADRSGPTLCAGCHRLLRGRPGDALVPLRTRSFAVVDGEARILDRTGMWDMLTAPPAGLRVLSWATGGQKQHHLRAGWSSPAVLRVGSDDGTILCDRAALRPVVESVVALRSGPPKQPAFTREEVLSGQYRPAAIARFGAAAWQEADAVVAPWRGSPALRLVVEFCPVTDVPSPSTPESVVAIDPLDQRWITLLGALALRSRLRESDPIAFWGTLFLRRVQRHAHRAFPDYLARLMQDLEVSPTQGAADAVADALHELDDDQQVAMMRRLDGRAPVLVALTYDARQQARAVPV